MFQNWQKVKLAIRSKQPIFLYELPDYEFVIYWLATQFPVESAVRVDIVSLTGDFGNSFSCGNDLDGHFR